MTLEELEDLHISRLIDFLRVAGKDNATDPAAGHRLEHHWSSEIAMVLTANDVTKSLGRLVKEAKSERRDWRPGHGKISISRYVLLDSDQVVRTLGVMRFPLSEDAEIELGNLSCYVPQAMRRRGYGSYCLALLLFEAVRAGMRRVLLTSRSDDPAARRMIEKNRGSLIDLKSASDGREFARYWVEFR